MGPLVPDVISDELSLIVALLLGIAFGFVLEQAGFSSSRKLTGLFYGTDFTVLRVFFSAGVTAMSGVLLLGQFGLLDLDLIYINPTFLHSAILGGVIMGVGFVLGGYCPGTSFCAAAVGRLDGMAFVGGGLLGVLGFGEIFPKVQEFYKAGAMGDLLVFTPLGLSAGQFGAALIVVAVAAFILTTRLERKVNPASESNRFPVRYHRMAGAALVALALVLPALPDRKARLTAMAADPEYARQHPVRVMAADELAIHLLDRDARVQLVDLRDAASYAKLTLPGAANLPSSALFGKEARLLFGTPETKKVLFDSSEDGSVRAAELAELLGYQNVMVLEGGLDGFRNKILEAARSSPELGSGDETYRFRLQAASQITTMIRERKAPKRTAAPLKRVQGGCGS